MRQILICFGKDGSTFESLTLYQYGATKLTAELMKARAKNTSPVRTHPEAAILLRFLDSFV